MGCASSGPLAKNLVDGAKDTAHDVAEMGENALHGATNVAKDGMEHVKIAVESAVHTAEHGLGTVIHKIEDTFSHKKEEATNAASDMKDAVDGLEAATDDAVKKATDGATEAVSEAETVLASEAEDIKEVLLTKTETKKEPVHKVEDNLTVEDMEDVADDGMGSTVEVGTTKKVEELVARVPTPVPTPPPELKEEPLTPWEKAADAIVNRPIYPSMRNPDVEPDKEPGRTDIYAEYKQLEAIDDVMDDKKIDYHTESYMKIEELV